EVAQALQAVRLWLYHREVPPPRLVPATPESALSIHALQDLVTAAQSLGEPTPAPLPLVQAPAPSGAPQRPAGLNPATRQAIQATLATGLSMAAGLLVAPTRWYWAVIGAYIMFIRATTLGETLVRGWQRILGTALGVLAGVVLAHLMRGHPVVEVVEMALACFLGFYFMGYSYLWMVVGITLLLAAFYLLLGRYSPELLVMRLELTLVGCVIGGIVAALVLPVPTNVKVRTTLIAVLRDLADLVEQSLEHRSAPDAVEHARPLDRKLQDLHEAAKPLTGRFLPLSSQGLHRALHYLAAGATFARHLVITSERLPESHPDVLLPIGCHVVDNIRAIAEDLSERKAIRHLEDAAACTEPLESALEQCPVPVREAVYWLEQLDEAIVGVGRTLDARLR
ncbi:MAG TPA: FUSC family protein, partial [Stenomitos sp.]